MSRPFRLYAVSAAIMLHLAAPVAAQDNNFHLALPDIELRLRADTFRVIEWRGSRMATDRTQRVTLEYADSMIMVVKWANAPRGGGVFNNEPRYELAAYEFQKFYLDPDDYVVPPTALRVFPLTFVREYSANVPATFNQAPNSVLVALQYWMSGVRQVGVWSEERFRHDTTYAHRVGNFNLLTHLIRHRDSNMGNFLISTDTMNPRIFAVDNGVSFGSPNSDRGDEWSFMRINRLPRAAVERLAEVTPEQLHETLGVLVEYEIRDGHLVQVEPGPNFDPGRGVRTQGDRLQIGLNRREIQDVANRVRTLVRQANNGKYRLF
jgi:hypothetical protein